MRVVVVVAVVDDEDGSVVSASSCGDAVEGKTMLSIHGEEKSRFISPVAVVVVLAMPRAPPGGDGEACGVLG